VQTQLREVITSLDDVLARLDPSLLSPADAVGLLESFEAIGRRANAGKTLVAQRATEGSAWARAGHRSPEGWLAQKSGSSAKDAGRVLDTSARLGELPVVSDALRLGKLSEDQASEIAGSADGSSEGRLVEAAQTAPLSELKRRCAQERDARRSAEAEEARRERVRRNRHFRSWTDADGAYCFSGSLTAIDGAKVDAAMAAMAERVFKEARSADRRETTANYRADAFVALVTEGGADLRSDVVIRVNASDLAAGRPSADDAVGAILAGAFVKVVVTDGIDISRAAHVGRHLPAELRSAVVERDGGRCVKPGCDSSHRLEVHHYRRDFAKGGATAYWNLATLCHFHHDLITTGGHRLDGGPGQWRWCEPR
jgi:uncharacterized protein DUF222